jgi:hypothetical protein
MKAALKMLRMMERSGVLPDAFVFTCLVDGYSKVLAMDGARWMMEEMEKRESQTYCSNLYSSHCWIP